MVFAARRVSTNHSGSNHDSSRGTSTVCHQEYALCTVKLSRSRPGDSALIKTSWGYAPMRSKQKANKESKGLLRDQKLTRRPQETSMQPVYTHHRVRSRQCSAFGVFTALRAASGYSHSHGLLAGFLEEFSVQHYICCVQNIILRDICFAGPSSGGPSFFAACPPLVFT